MMLFLDLDGCFADFASAAAKQINIYLSTYRKLGTIVLSKTVRKNMKVLVDLGIDEVRPINLTHQNISVSEDILPRLTDNEVRKRKAVKRLVMWVANQEGFFLDLPVMNNNLLYKIRDSGIPFAFLSAPMNNNFCVTEKNIWIQSNLQHWLANSVYRGSLFLHAKDKCWLASEHTVLFDDKPETVHSWRAAGGTAFLCPHEQSEFVDFIRANAQ